MLEEQEIAFQKRAREHLKQEDKAIEALGEAYHVWPIYFFTPSGKWKYTDYVVMTKPESWVEFDVLIQQALNNTPEEIRETRIRSIDSWTVVMLNNPLGFPIMVHAKENW